MLPWWYKAVLFLLTLHAHYATVSSNEDTQNQPLIENVVVIGDDVTTKLDDINKRKDYSVHEGLNPMFIVKLGGAFKLSQIQVRAPQSGKETFTEFDVSVNEYFINPCLYTVSRDWKICQTKVKFSEPNQLINITCDGVTNGARYVKFSTGQPENYDPVPGPHVSQMFFYGERVGDDTLSSIPDDEPTQSNLVQEWRNAIFGGIHWFRFDSGYASFEMNHYGLDVPILWTLTGVVGIAGPRGKGRVVAIMGDNWWKGMYTNKQLLINLQRFLGNGRYPLFHDADKPQNPGDILVVRRGLKFNAWELMKQLQSGNHSLVIPFQTYPSDTYSDDASKLLDMLGIYLNKFMYSWGLLNLNPSLNLNSDSYMPVSYHLDLVTKNWTLMRTLKSDDLARQSERDLTYMSLSPFQLMLRKFLGKYYRYFSERSPCEKHPRDVSEEGLTAWWNFNQYMLIQTSEDMIPIPGTHLHPGMVRYTEKRITHRVSLKPQYGADFIPIGVYANPGQKFKVRVLAHSHKLGQYSLTFGCLSDRLGQNRLVRLPRVWQSVAFKQEATFSPLVGGVLLLMTRGGGQSITLEFEGVYRHPWFDIRNKSSVDDWDNERKRYNGVPWMAYMGDAMHICLPTKHVVKLNKDDMVFSVTYLDHTVKIIHNFRGSNYEAVKWQVFAVDVQIYGGWGHSGYPLMGHIPWHEEFTNIAQLKRQSAIGMTHEVGHNLQVYEMTFKNGGEVTNNIYHFPVRGHLVNLTAYGYDVFRGLTKGEIDYMLNTWRGSEYVGVKDGYYNYLGFIFGEGLLSNLMASALAQGRKLVSEVPKVNFWLTSMCKETEYNVLPWQELFHFPITDETRKVCGQYKCFLPEDKVTSQVPDLVERQIKKYGGNCDRKTERQVKIKRDLFRGFWQNREVFVTFL